MTGDQPEKPDAASVAEARRQLLERIENDPNGLADWTEADLEAALLSLGIDPDRAVDEEIARVYRIRDEALRRHDANREREHDG